MTPGWFLVALAAIRRASISAQFTAVVSGNQRVGGGRRASGGSRQLPPFPVPDLGHVLAELVNVGLVLDELVLDHLL